jgi:hypothetical protein
METADVADKPGTRMERPMRARTFLCGLLIALIMPAGALGAAIPPGNSAVDQYSETYPGAGGGETSNPPGSSGAAPDKSLGDQTAQNFSNAGPDGQAAADLAAATAPQQAGSRGPAASGGTADTGSGSGDSGPLEVAQHAVGASDSGGMGLLLPLLLAAAVLGFGTLLALRARRVRVG